MIYSYMGLSLFVHNLAKTRMCEPFHEVCEFLRLFREWRYLGLIWFNVWNGAIISDQWKLDENQIKTKDTGSKWRIYFFFCNKMTFWEWPIYINTSKINILILFNMCILKYIKCHVSLLFFLPKYVMVYCDHFCLSVCLSVCLTVWQCVCHFVCKHDQRRTKYSIFMKFTQIVYNHNRKVKFEDGLCPFQGHSCLKKKR